jgi:hypothetical protein
MMKSSGDHMSIRDMCQKDTSDLTQAERTICEDSLIQQTLKGQTCDVDTLDSLVDLHCASCLEDTWICKYPRQESGTRCISVDESHQLSSNAPTSMIFSKRASCEETCSETSGFEMHHRRNRHHHRGSRDTLHHESTLGKSPSDETVTRRNVSCVNTAASTPGWVHLGWAGESGTSEGGKNDCEKDPMGASGAIDLS